MEALWRKKGLMGCILLEFLAATVYLAGAWLRSVRWWVYGLIALFLAYSAVILWQERKNHRKAPAWWCVYKGLQKIIPRYFALFAIIAGTAFLTMFASKIKGSTGSGIRITAVEAETLVVEKNGQSIINNSGLLIPLQSEKYKQLDDMGKAKVLNQVVAVEAAYLGIEAPGLQVAMLKENLVGQYLVDKNIILINEMYIADEEVVLKGILHEIYHAYQYACMEVAAFAGDLLFCREVEQWRKESEAYEGSTNTKEGMVEYYTQSMEMSARWYAEERLKEYGKIIILGNTP